jgi:hypothetical protein
MEVKTGNLNEEKQKQIDFARSIVETFEIKQ